METYFAPAGRTERRKFRNQLGSISQSPLMNTLLETMSGMLVVLNEDRQVVALNYSFLDALGITDAEEVLGLRLGETLHCIHAHEEPNGCGTTSYCATCGAAIALMSAIVDDRVDEQICALSAERDGVVSDMCLVIRAQPVKLEGHRFVLVFAQDITKYHFWTNLERVFFHDMNNLLCSVLGNCELLAVDMPDNEDVRRIKDGVKRLCCEVDLQKSLSQHKDSQYLLRKSEISLSDIWREVGLVVNGHPFMKGKEFDEDWPVDDITVNHDILLITRVLGNMIVNALEATKEGGRVTLKTTIEDDTLVWQVWNRCFIPEDVQKRIFQRHFSTKSSAGRGLGTYSMKLFGEKFMGGKVDFVSSEEHGTTFTFRLPRS